MSRLVRSLLTEVISSSEQTVAYMDENYQICSEGVGTDINVN